VLYDVTTLHFERDYEDELHKAGSTGSTRRFRPGSWRTLPGSASRYTCWAETTTLIPVFSAFAQRPEARDMVVVADAKCSRRRT
jgi:hypothetical protein